MNLKNFLEGVAIISKYYDNPEGYHIGADNDQIYLYATDNAITEEDISTLRDLGWFQPEVGTDDEYSPGDGWSSWV